MKPAIQDAAKALFDTIFEHEQCWGGPGDAVEIAMTAIADHYDLLMKQARESFTPRDLADDEYNRDVVAGQLQWLTERYGHDVVQRAVAGAGVGLEGSDH